MADKHRKRCSTTLIIREIQIKTTERYHLIPTRISTIKYIYITSDKCCPRYGEIGMFEQWWWECIMVSLLWKLVQQFLKK